MSNITTITPIVQGMKGSVVSQVLNANFQNILNELKNLKAENELLKKTAMIGNNGTGGITDDAVVNIMYDPQTIIAKTSDTDEYYTVNVKVMCGNQEVFAGDVDSVENNTYKVIWDKQISVGGLTCVIDRVGEQSLSFRVKVGKNSIADGSFGFHITYRGITYDYKVNIVSVNKDPDFDYAQGIFVSTIFTRNDETPDIPVGGTYNIPLPSTLEGDVRGEHQGWSDGIPSGTRPLYTCHRKFTSNGQKPQDSTWSQPILAMDSADIDVCFTNWSNGTPLEPNGPKGSNQDEYEQPYGWHNVGQEDDIWMATCVKKGNEWGDWSIVKVKGENGTSSDWKNTIYKESDSKPLRPTSNTTDFIDNPSATSPNDGWHDVPNDNGTWWMSSAYIDGDTSRVQKDENDNYWSEPVKVTAGSSQAVFVSTVFKRSMTNPGKPLDPGDFNEPVPSGWSDGIPADTSHTNYPVWQTHKKFTSDNLYPQDDDWSEPILMMDTADFDCCFCYYTGSTAPGNPNDNQGQDDGSAYHWHEPEYATADDNWMATRYKAANSTWGKWVITRIKGESGSDGNYTNYIFKASSTSSLTKPNILDPRKFVDVDNDKIKDDDGRTNTEERNQGWVDGPGIGDIWWMSCAVIDGTTGKAIEGWSTPTKLTGERGVDGSWTDYRYGINDNALDPTVYDNSNQKVPFSEWDDSVSGALHTLTVKHIAQEVLPAGSKDYTSVPSLHYMWMAFQRWIVPQDGTELIAQPWEYARVTGERGEDGTKLKINGSKDSYRELFLLSVDANNNRRQNLPEDGASYVVNQEMWVWSESADWKNADSTTIAAYDTSLDPAKWQNCGGIVGPPGESQYLHILYADDLDVEITDEHDQVIGHCPRVAHASPEGCRYMGTLVNNEVESPNTPEALKLYTWSKFTGADGYGYEYIYKLGTTMEPFNVPLSAQCKEYWYKETENGIINSYTTNKPDNTYKKKTFQDNDYVPSGWTDNPSGITEAYPFEFMCKRVRQNGEWQEFTGQAGANTKAILYTYKGKDAPYQKREWATFDAFVWKPEMVNGQWLTSIPDPDTYLGGCLWQREKTITPVTGSAPDEETEWKYLRISGEKGNEGTSLNVKGTFETLNELFLLAYTNQGQTYDASNLKSGDAYTVSGHMWTWNASNDKLTTTPSAYGTPTPQTHWRDAGEIVGPAGQSQYIHIKYADTVSACTENGKVVYKVLENEWLTSWISEHDGELPGTYIGICVTESETDPDVNLEPDKQNYKWSKYQGEDGIDYEIIYTRTSGKTEPDDSEHEGVLVPRVTNKNYYSGTSEGFKMYCADPEAGFNDNGTPKNDNIKKLFQSDDFIPTTKTKEKLNNGNDRQLTTHNWTDNPMGPTDELPYEWACRRDKIKGVWTNFYGKASDTEYAYLYNFKGKGALGIDISCGQYLVFNRVANGTTAAIQTKVIEFTLTKDGLAQTLDKLEIADNVDKKSVNGTVTRIGMATFFDMPTIKKNGDANCNNPYISLTTKQFTLESGYTYSFDVTLTHDNVKYVKQFTIALEAKNGEKGSDGEPIIQHEIVADKPSLTFNAAGKLDMDDNDGIGVMCYVRSGDTRTEINWSTNRGDYSIYYNIDSLGKNVMTQDIRTNGNSKGVYVSKNNLNTVTKEVTITLESGTTAQNRIVCQTIKIPVLYDVGSRDNLFSKDNPINCYYTDTNDGRYGQVIHTNSGFTAVLPFNGNTSKVMGVSILDNPNNPCFESGCHYVMTGELQLKYASGATTYSGEDVRISAYTASYLYRATPSQFNVFTGEYGINVNSIGRNWSSWYPFEWKTPTTGYSYNPVIGFYRNTHDTSKLTTMYVNVRNLKIEKLARFTDKPTPYNGLGETTSLAMTRPNLFEKSSSFNDPFLVYWDNDNYSSAMNIDVNNNPRSGITSTRIPYAYCGNSVLEVKDSCPVANSDSSRWASFMIYEGKVNSGQYYTISWYQRSIPNDDYTKQKLWLNITNSSNLVPKMWVVGCSGKNSVFGDKVKGSAVGASFEMTKDWTRQYFSFYYMPSGNTETLRNLSLAWYYLNSSGYANHGIQITMPKLEMGDFPTTWQQNDSDRIGKPLRGPSAWKPNKEYQGGGPDDDFQDLVTFNNTSNMYLCKITHISSSDVTPGNGSVDRAWDNIHPWQVTEKRDFIAAEVMYSDKLASAIFDALRARINELQVKNLRTENDNGATIDIQDGAIKVYGTNKDHPNIVFGVDSNTGAAVLSFYDNDGNWQYDLAPSRIVDTLSDVNPKITERSYYYLTPSSSADTLTTCPLFRYINSPSSSQTNLKVGMPGVSAQTFYEHTDGETGIGAGKVKGYYAFDKDSPTSAHTKYHGRLFTDSSLTQPVHNRILCTSLTWPTTNSNKIAYMNNSYAQPVEAVYYLEGLPALKFKFYTLNTHQDELPLNRKFVNADFDLPWFLYVNNSSNPDKQTLVDLSNTHENWRSYVAVSQANGYIFSYSNEELLNKYNLKYTSQYGKALLYYDESNQRVLNLDW